MCVSTRGCCALGSPPAGRRRANVHAACHWPYSAAHDAKVQQRAALYLQLLPVLLEGRACASEPWHGASTTPGLLFVPRSIHKYVHVHVCIFTCERVYWDIERAQHQVCSRSVVFIPVVLTRLVTRAYVRAYVIKHIYVNQHQNANSTTHKLTNANMSTYI